MTLFAHENDYDAVVNSVSQVYGVPAPLIKAVIAQESRFNPNAKRAEPGGDASWGLMQLLYRTAVGDLDFNGQAEALLDPGVNIPLGTRYLAQQFGKAGTWDGAVSAYNGGWRPSLGFGVPATTPHRICLRRNAATGECERWHDVPVGEYANQEYVDRVRAYEQYFRTGELSGPVALAGIGGAIWLVPIGVALFFRA